MPKISIILPTYNVEKYIARALDSCINQTLKDIEIIVVDDKGQDKSIEIAKDYASRDNRIKIVDNKVNLKLFHARINGVQNASADYIIFLDPDDELELNTCEYVYNAWLDKNCSFIMFKIQMIYQDKIKSMWNYSFQADYASVQFYMDEFLNIGWNICGKAFKKVDFLNIANKVSDYGYSGNMCEDYIFTYFALIYYKQDIKIINKFLYKYYINNESTTQTTNLDKMHDNLLVFKNVLDIINTRGVQNKFSNEYLLAGKERYFWHVNRLLSLKKEQCYIKEYVDYIESIKLNKQLYLREKYNFSRIFRKDGFIEFMRYLYNKLRLKFYKN